MRYDIEIGGRTRQLLVARAGDGFAVTLDGHAWQVDAKRIDAHTLSLVVDGVSRKSHDVVVAADPGSGQLTVRVGTTPIAVTVNGTRRWGRKDDGAGRGDGPQRIAAPMPGKIVRVLVKPGDPGASFLITKLQLTSTDPAFGPGQPASAPGSTCAATLGVIEQWIQLGAPDN